MQRIWRSIGWDDVLLERDYAKWVDDEVKLSQLRIPRCYALRSSKIELHVFGDASEHAYAAVAYWRGTTRRHGTSALVAGKSRVAPNVVAARTASGAFGLSPSDEYPKEHGIATEHAWPIDNDVVDERVADDEVKGESINVVCTTHTGDVIDVTRFSSWTRLVRTYARVLYFIRRLRKQQQPFGADDVIDAETRLLRASQRRAFSDEMRAAVGAATPEEAVYGRWTSC
ncbi:hypothetical protein EVAR_38383_1 [Eumeta japonica]|uniref:Uncharacterized protein n=1 Tax=Eumeta variegata TaxID=151549 RepID=A0A4C1YJT4_EUMVA|nr:hypothetical protein EVAR_38383_1 [Eumeta japonica]